MIKNGILIKFTSSYELSEFIQQVSTREENIDKSYTFYFYAHLIKGRVVRTTGMQKYLITSK